MHLPIEDTTPTTTGIYKANQHILNPSKGLSVPCDTEKIQGHTKSASIYDTLRQSIPSYNYNTRKTLQYIRTRIKLYTAGDFGTFLN